MRNALLLFTFLLSCSLTLSSVVEVLTEENFDSFVNENKLVLVEFYAPWCGHCKRLEPEYNKAAEELEGVEARLAKVDCDSEKNIAVRFGIKGFPTLKIFRSGEPADYPGGRTASDIVKYVQRQSEPALNLLTTPRELEAFIPTAPGKPPVVVAFTNPESEVGQFITAFSSKFRDEYSFGLVASPDTAKDEVRDTIVLFKPFDELKNVFLGELTEAALAGFLKLNSFPAVDEIGPENYRTYMERGLPLGWLFVDPSDTQGTEAAKQALRAVAPDVKLNVSLVYLDGVKYQQMATKLGLSGESLPAFGVDDNNKHFLFPEGEDITEAALQEWFGRYFSGELPRTVKSEPLPDPLLDENNVATLVGNNFEEIVLDATKDVLVEFYAPWCGHCKSLVPIWNSLGLALKDVPSVVIAKFDATANDATGDFQVSGFPTIYLSKSGDNQVVKFAGDRSLNGFLAWLQENAGTPFELPATIAEHKPWKVTWKKTAAEMEADTDEEEDKDKDEL